MWAISRTRPRPLACRLPCKINTEINAVKKSERGRTSIELRGARKWMTMGHPRPRATVTHARTQARVRAHAAPPQESTRPCSFTKYKNKGNILIFHHRSDILFTVVCLQFIATKILYKLQILYYYNHKTLLYALNNIFYRNSVSTSSSFFYQVFFIFGNAIFNITLY